MKMLFNEGLEINLESALKIDTLNSQTSVFVCMLVCAALGREWSPW